jgi:4-hydroxy-3-methylbut-2-enyl diphosphate reductase
MFFIAKLHTPNSALQIQLLLSIPYLYTHMEIIVDYNAGFCPGVHRAIRKAEQQLSEKNELHSYGAILHNELVMQRLEGMGLKLADKEDIPDLSHKKLLIRAHGEPPETFRLAEKYGVDVIDATCGVVKRLQLNVRVAAEEMKRVNGQVVIYGKHGHPELIGLIGHAMGLELVITTFDEIKMVDPLRPVRLFSQTTMDGDIYESIGKAIFEKMNQQPARPDFISYNTICRYVSNRIPGLKKFSSRFDVIIFVSGKDSSNGKKLFEICRKVNPRTYFVSGVGELKKEWFLDAAKVGISGAASTPQWLMEEIAHKIKEMA